ncbi:hypothetical protein SDC9_111715 [bioreactor metagenome]|uniref:Uncharacterized protein n=1 Tax=bioreactor metagenome TaxID=1076179 RepID=A0A645BSQ6_9ZZZZ
MVDLVGKELILQINADDVRQMGLLDRVIQPCLGAAVREFFATSFHPGILRIEFADPRVRLRLQGFHPFAAQCLSILSHFGIMGNDQAQSAPRQFADDFLLGIGALHLKGVEQFGKFAITPTGNGQHELQWLTAFQADLGERLQVVQRQQAPICHQHHPANRREAFEHRLQGRQQRRRFRRVTGKHLVVDRQAITRLHHTEHHLTSDEAFLGHAEPADIAFLVRGAFRANGGHVVEHHRQFLVDQGTQKISNHGIDLGLMIDQSIHAAQQMLVGDRFHLNARHRYRIQPAQHPEFRFRIAQAIEHHAPNQCLDIDAVPGLAEYTAQLAKAQRFPEFVECPNVAKRTRRFELDCGQWRIQEIRSSGHLEQPGDDGIQAVSQLIQAPKCDQRAMLGLAGVVTEGFDKLEILARTGTGDLEEHANTLPARKCLSNMATKTIDVPLHDFLENRLQTRMAAWATSRK